MKNKDVFKIQQKKMVKNRLNKSEENKFDILDQSVTCKPKVKNDDQVK